MGEAARAPLAASASPCSRALHPGEYKRVPRNARMPAVGWFLACPACRFVGAYSPEEVGAEERDKTGGGVSLVGIMGTPHCSLCHRVLAVRGHDLVALEST